MRIVPIVGIMAVAWFLIIAETYVFFDVILTYTPPIHELGSFTALAVLKVAATLGLGILWFVVMLVLTQVYVRSRLRRRTPTVSS